MKTRAGRQLCYTRALIDREATTDDGPIRFVGATEGVKGDGIDLRMSGARLDRYRANPVVGYGHNYWGRQSLPIGKSEATEVDGKRLLFDVRFDPADDFATTVDRKYRDGYLNAVSIGFDVIGWENPNSTYWTGGVATDWELFELSAVPLPMDADAVVESGRARALHTALAELREGKVLSAANQQLVEDAMAALATLLDSTGTTTDDEDRGRPVPAGGRSLAAARRRARLAGIR